MSSLEEEAQQGNLGNLGEFGDTIPVNLSISISSAKLLSNMMQNLQYSYLPVHYLFEKEPARLVVSPTRQ
jgi:predicted RNA-binding protein with EMAP domain